MLQKYPSATVIEGFDNEWYKYNFAVIFYL